jgi:hypothetical protein
MDKEVKKDIISVLTQALFLIKKEDFLSLKELSNHIIHSASIVQDKYSIQTAVLVYALSKILEREKQKGQKISPTITQLLERLVDSSIQDNEGVFDTVLKELLDQIADIDKNLPWHVQRVIEKAHIVKGSNMYRHGISIGRVANILGLTQWELMSYIGKTRISDKEELGNDVKERLAFTKRLFRVP